MMSRFLFALLLVLVTVSVSQAQANPDYNKSLADSLGSDERGMKMYQLVILKTGPVTIADKDSVKQVFSGHMQNIGKLVKDGYLVVAGPFGKNDKQYRGLFILKARDKEEAEKLLLTDPAIKTGLLTYDLLDWYGSAALPMYLPHSEKISKTKF
ncbi:YciI family protein [Niabella hibiscisoli]|uniref:YciI family protein n=1 Tax=Niabella hibiscisoli TaxID=1825928 RepID=UPI001F0EB587|nr:YciI family protein [Niabella hibiscisoli]MCH5717101.1 YciI family protein [Niabella hibiscisoli]